MRTIAGLIVGLLMLAPGPAEAGFKGNRTDWDGMSAESQFAYVMGAFDQRVGVADFANSKVDAAVRQGFGQCAVDLELTPRAIAKLITEGYQADAARYSWSPERVMWNQLARVCRTYISDERVKLGLSPLPPN